MDDINVSTKAKSSAVTSVTKASRQTSNQPKPTPAGGQPLTEAKDVTGVSVTSAVTSFQKQAEKIRDVLAMVKDVLNLWPCRMPNGEMPKPYISLKHGVLMIALPLGGHVIENMIVDGKHDFDVDGQPVIPIDVTETPVTSG